MPRPALPHVRRPVAVLTVAMLAAVAGLAMPVGPTAAQQPAVTPSDRTNAVTGVIDSVTVYRGQALVTRVIDAGPAGLREIVVTDLPEAILPGSLYAESADGVEVRSVSYRVRPVGADARESVRNAEKAVQDARDALEAAKSQEKYHEWQRQYLDKLENFVAPAAQAELKNGVLNPDTLTKLTDLVTTRRKTQTAEWQKLSIDIRTLTEAVNLKERELAVLTASTSRTAREAVVFINATRAGARVRLSYLVNGANWSPSYNLRIADAKAEKAMIEYQASVQQMSGEDWNGVNLTLSTATPALVATGPSLQPLTVALVSPQQAQAKGAQAMLKDRGYDDAKRVLAEQQRDIERNRAVSNLGNDTRMFANNAPRGEAGRPGGQTIQEFQQQSAGADAVVLSLDAGLNSLADQSELLDLVSNKKLERKSKAEPVTVRQGDEGISVTYKVASKTTMPSRADQQLIQIAQMELPARITKSATPTLTQYVYNEAQFTNSGDIVLLAGPAASYLAGEFVGSSGVPTVTAGESFRAGFGIDSSLRTSKELIERKEETQGGNRIIDFTYKLTIENFGKAPAAVRLLDRLPIPKGSEIKLTMLDQKPPLSEDKDYQDTERKKNLLRWDLTAAPGATGTKALTVEYRFRLEFDKQMTLTEGQ